MNDPKGIVYLVEDDPSFRKSLERLLRESEYEAVSFESAHSFLEQESIRSPACLILDVCLPDMDGLRLYQKIKEKGKKLPVIFMTGQGTIPMSVRAMKEGAIDFLPKPLESGVLLSAIDRALEQNAKDVRKSIENKKIKVLIDTLTPREKEILRWVISGRLNKQTAYELGIAEKTVKVHRGRIMEKTGVSSVAELVRLAEKADIPPLD